MSRKLLFISNIAQHSQTGGANAVNYHIFRELEKTFDCAYHYINPSYSKYEKLVSNINRKVLKRPGAFFFFSNRRLKRIAKEFESISWKYDLVFLKGVTPWVLCNVEVPYFLYCDVGFKQFFENTFNPKDFLKHDISRILDLENSFLSKATTVFFESYWGLERTANYVKTSGHFISVGRGGSISLPNEDQYSGGYRLLVIANDFYQKGGDLTYKAMKQLSVKYPDLKLHVIGGAPSQDILNDKQVEYHGRFNKEDQKDLDNMVTIIKTSFVLMHITREDINPLVPTEVGYFGCPTISINKFAIPELVIHGRTGLLCNSYEIQEIVEQLDLMISDKTMYNRMRQETFEWNRYTFSWETIGEIVKKEINKNLV